MADSIGIDFVNDAAITEMGAIIALIPPSEEVLQFCRERSGKPDLVPIAADPDAEYVETVEIDIEGLAPMAARPGHPAFHCRRPWARA